MSWTRNRGQNIWKNWRMLDCPDLEVQIEVHSMTISKYKQPKYMGFGLKVQKLLWSKIREIGRANEIDPDEAVQKFMKDMELYDDKLGFEP
jgi:hypothetical protein